MRMRENSTVRSSGEEFVAYLKGRVAGLDGDADELFDIMVDIYANPVKEQTVARIVRSRKWNANRAIDKMKTEYQKGMAGEPFDGTDAELAAMTLRNQTLCWRGSMRRIMPIRANGKLSCASCSAVWAIPCMWILISIAVRTEHFHRRPGHHQYELYVRG